MMVFLSLSRETDVSTVGANLVRSSVSLGFSSSFPLKPHSSPLVDPSQIGSFQLNSSLMRPTTLYDPHVPILSSMEAMLLFAVETKLWQRGRFRSRLIDPDGLERAAKPMRKNRVSGHKNNYIFLSALVVSLTFFHMSGNIGIHFVISSRTSEVMRPTEGNERGGGIHPHRKA